MPYSPSEIEQIKALAAKNGLAAKPEVMEEAMAIVNRIKDGFDRVRAERMRECLKANRAAGRRHSRHAPLFWKWGGRQKKTLVPFPEERKCAQVITAMRTIQGLSWSEIARTMLLNKVPSPRREWTVSRVRQLFSRWKQEFPNGLPGETPGPALDEAH